MFLLLISMTDKSEGWKMLPPVTMVVIRSFMHDRTWISWPWIKSISNELNITFRVIVSRLSGYFDVIANQLWRHQHSVNRASETRRRCVKIVVFYLFMEKLCRVRNTIMYVLWWRTLYALTRVLFSCLFPSLLCNSGNKHQNNPSRERMNSLSRGYIHFLYRFPSQRTSNEFDNVFFVGRLNKPLNEQSSLFIETLTSMWRHLLQWTRTQKRKGR